MRYLYFLAVSMIGLVSCNLYAATLSGKVSLAGNPPRPVSIDMSNEPVCSKAYPKEGATFQKAVLGPNGGLQNVVVYISSNIPFGNWQLPTSPQILTQKNCVYSPHVIAMRVGQVLKVLNQDPVEHNVHVTPRKNRESNSSQTPRSAPIEMKFANEEVGMKVVCNLHPWMSSYVSTFSHPFFAVTAPDGTFAIPNLPAGQYTVTAWHEVYGMRTFTVTVKQNNLTQNIEFQQR